MGESALLIVITPKGVEQVFPVSVTVGEHNIVPDFDDKDPPRNLGLYMDSSLTFEYHVKKVCKSANYNLYSIGKIRRLLSQANAEKLVNALVTSRLDHCNGVLFGAKKSVINPLRLCQNHDARVVTLSRKRSHITPVLKKLHWLPLAQRINFKLLMLTYK